VLRRLLVYWGIRDDPELDDRWATQGVDRRTRLLGLPLGIVAVVCMLTLVALFVSLVTGAGIDLGGAAAHGVRWAGVVLGLLMVGNIAFEWVDWLRTRSHR